MSLIIERIENMPIDSNSYVIYDCDYDSCIIIDPGSGDCNLISDFILAKKIKPKYIFLTHEHFDHIWGVNFLRKEFNLKVISNVYCSESIINKRKNLSIFYNQVGFECAPSDFTFDNYFEFFYMGEIFKFYSTPGHTHGSICISIRNYLFTGDTMIKGLNTVIKLPGGSKVKLDKSLNFIHNNFDESTILLPGHGDYFFLSSHYY